MREQNARASRSRPRRAKQRFWTNAGASAPAAAEGDLRAAYFATKRADPDRAQYFVGNPFAAVR